MHKTERINEEGEFEFSNKGFYINEVGKYFKKKQRRGVSELYVFNQKM